jgi:capsular polysaccharide export protein
MTNKLLPLIRIPPFPGARAPSFARPTAGRAVAVSADEIDELIELIARERVGGTYWGAQPEMPAGGYTLLAVRKGPVRAKLMGEISPSTAVFCCDPIQGCDPWHVVSGAAQVIVDAHHEIALIAAIAGVPVGRVGEARLSPLDPIPAVRAAVRKQVTELAYANPFTGEPITARDAIELGAFWRKLIDDNRELRAAFGIARWKRPTVAPLLWGGPGTPRFGTSSGSLGESDRVAVWRSRASAKVLDRLERQGARLVEVEDGFIRSIGLGADCVPPLSIIVDRLGIYFDAGGPSDLEQILQEGAFPTDLVARARALRELIVARGISKYETGARPVAQRPSGGHRILVPGQVEDDRAVLAGGQGLTSNLELLRRVRAEAPDAYILYKPHPDVEAGHRRGAIADEACRGLADEVVRGVPISQLIDLADEIHVNTSLAGFEALLRQKPVTTHGVPFYAGWGLTKDLGSIPSRRSARRTLDELVAGALILYPRYVDPQTGLPCPAEILVRRLALGGDELAAGALVGLRRLHGRVKRQLAKIGK